MKKTRIFPWLTYNMGKTNPIKFIVLQFQKYLFLSSLREISIDDVLNYQL